MPKVAASSTTEKRGAERQDSAAQGIIGALKKKREENARKNDWDAVLAAFCNKFRECGGGCGGDGCDDCVDGSKRSLKWFENEYTKLAKTHAGMRANCAEFPALPDKTALRKQIEARGCYLIGDGDADALEVTFDDMTTVCVGDDNFRALFEDGTLVYPGEDTPTCPADMDACFNAVWAMADECVGGAKGGIRDVVNLSYMPISFE